MSVYKRGDRWWYDFTISGVRYRKSIPQARTKRKAEEVEDRIKVSIYEGTYNQPSARTLTEFIDEVFRPWAKTNYRSAPSRYESAIEVIKSRLGALTLREIAPITIERFKRTRLAEKTKRGGERKPSSVNRELTYLSRILSLAKTDRLIRENPAHSVACLAEAAHRTRVLAYEEEVMVLAWLDIHSPQSANAVRVALGTGMRRGEIVALRWNDLNWSRRIIQIRTSKTGKPRTVPINRQVESALADQRQLTNGSDRVFGICAERITAAFRKAARTCKLDDLRFHDLRHTAATRMGAAGVDAFTLAELLGHSDIKQTRDYTHALDSEKRRAVEALVREAEPRATVTNLSQHWKEEAV